MSSKWAFQNHKIGFQHGANSHCLPTAFSLYRLFLQIVSFLFTEESTAVFFPPFGLQKERCLEGLMCNKPARPIDYLIAPLILSDLVALERALSLVWPTGQSVRTERGEAFWLFSPIAVIKERKKSCLHFSFLAILRPQSYVGRNRNKIRWMKWSLFRVDKPTLKLPRAVALRPSILRAISFIK